MKQLDLIKKIDEVCNEYFWDVWWQSMDDDQKKKVIGKSKALESALDKIEAAQRTGSVIDLERKKSYGPEANCGDAIALAVTSYIRGEDGKFDPKKFDGVAIENDLEPGRWDHVNNGMKVMNLTNVLRGINKRDENPVFIGGTKFGGLS